MEQKSIRQSDVAVPFFALSAIILSAGSVEYKSTALAVDLTPPTTKQFNN